MYDPALRDWYVDLGNNQAFLVVRTADDNKLTAADCDWLQRVVNRATAPLADSTPVKYPHPQAERVVAGIVPQALERYVEKCGDYGDDDDPDAQAGQYFQMKKRMRKLRRVLLEGQTLTGESATEVLQDFIADCALAIDYIERGVGATNPRD